MKSLEGFSFSFGRGLKFAAAALVIFATGILSNAEPVTITTSVVGEGVVLGNGTFESGTEFTLRAAPKVDWRFDHWEGVPPDLSQSNPVALTAAANLHPSAVMAASPGSGRFAGASVIGYNATVPPGLTNVVDVSAGGQNTVVIKADGTVYGWNASNPSQKTIPPDVGDVSEVDAGPNHILVLNRDGTVSSFGAETNVPVGLTNVAAVAAGSHHSLALNQDGTVVAWGANNFGQSSAPSGLRDVVSIAAGDAFSVALKSDGTAVAWGQLHSPSGDYAPLVLPPSFTNLVAISASYNYILGLKADGSVVNAGYIDIFSSSVTPADLNGTRALAAGWENGLAIDTNNVLRYWGRPGIDPIPDTFPNIIAADAGDEFFYGIQGPGFGLLRESRNSMFLEENQPLILAPSTIGGDGYQWFHNGQPIIGANSAILSIPSLAMSDAGAFQLAVTNETDAFVTPATDVQIAPAGYPRVIVNGREIRGSTRVSQAQVALTTTLSNPQIFYTLDGSAPALNSTRYTAPFSLSAPTNVIVRALALSGDFARQATNVAVTIDVASAYTVTITSSGPGTVLVTPNTPQFFLGDHVTLQAVPNANGVFVDWSKDISGSDPVQELVIDRNFTIQANFTNAPKFSATIIAPPGAVTLDPSGPQYAGTDVTITALPKEGWLFEGWSGDHTGTETTFIWHVSGPASFTATYDTTVTTISSGPGHIELNPNLPRYDFDAQVEVIPVPDFGNHLALWGLDGAGQPTTPWTLTVTNAEPKISALFQPSSTPAYKITEPMIQDGQFAMHVTGTIGTSITIQSTSDFIAWTDEQTLTLQNIGGTNVIIPLKPGVDERFYRIRQNP